MPATPEDLFAKLGELGIETTTVTHPPGVHIKNLFLCDAKKKMWLVVAPWDRKVDLKALPEKIGGGRMSFGSADRLCAYWA